jgi:flagellar hook protein FlgE
MLQAMLSSVASIQAQQSRMDVIGDNLANINTTAFKGSRTNFEEMMAQTVREGANPIQFGQGVLVGSTDTNTQQGSLNATNRPDDLALQGNGYFVVNTGNGLQYTRDGSFGIDANGNLIQQSTGAQLLGWAADANGKIDTNAGVTGASTLTIPLGTATAFKATTSLSMAGNLDSSAKATDSFTTTVQVFDSLGASHDISVSFSNHTSPPAAGGPAGSKSSWSWTAKDGSNVIGSSSTTGNQDLFFDATGNLLNPKALGNISIPAASGTAAQPIALDFSTLTQISGTTQVQAGNQDGFAPGQLQSFTIGQDGIITGVFSNGLTRSLGEVAVAQFENPGGLSRNGGNLFGETSGSGPSSIGVAGQGGRGSIQAGYLEQSNVDIGTEFTNLIITQRGYQANTKVVTTVDDMLQTLIDMKR